MTDHTSQPREQKKKTGKKSPWRFVFLACAVYGAWELLGSLCAWILYLGLADPIFSMTESTSVGIIGGADGPTAIFVTTPGWTGYVVPVLALGVGIWGFLRFSRQKRK